VEHKHKQIISIMKNDLKDLLNEVISANINYLRLNDLNLKTGGILVFGTKLYKNAKGEDDYNPCLVDERHNKFTASVNQLAAMRMATTGDALPEWHEDFKSDGGQNFQNIAIDLVTNNTKIETLKLKVIGQLKMRNHFATKANTPIYKDNCYEGHASFYKAKFDLRDGKEAGYTSTTEYKTKVYELGNTLHATPLVESKATPENIEYLPVLTIVS
jgi:hypothetical protein